MDLKKNKVFFFYTEFRKMEAKSWNIGGSEIIG